MGDRVQLGGRRWGRGRTAEPSAPLGKRPDAIATWGLSPPQALITAGLGHNGGPDLDHPENDLYVHWKWRQVHREVWKPPSPAIARLRVARAEAAGVDYRTYMAVHFDTGKFLQRRDAVAMALARPTDAVLATPDAQSVQASWRQAARPFAPRSGDGARKMEAMGLALIAAYSGADRHYHDVRHIAFMLDAARGFDRAARAPAATLAILLHDIVYDAQRSDNEAQSADLARGWLTELGAPQALIEDVADLVLATRHTRGDDDFSAEARALIDLDLAVLGADAGTYDAYAHAIRREYSHVPDDAFTVGRCTVIDQFIARSSLYLTSIGRARWEALARANLMRERKRLSDRSRSP